MKNEYEITLNDELAEELREIYLEFAREVAELEALDQMDAGYIDE